LNPNPTHENKAENNLNFWNDSIAIYCSNDGIGIKDPENATICAALQGIVLLWPFGRISW
jgi:hypothetical protein